MHVKTNHAENYFEIRRSGRFLWKLPKQGDQQDIGIIKDRKDHYIYEMFYEDNSGNLYFSLNWLGDNQFTRKEYRFSLKNTVAEVMHIKRINSAKEVLKPICERSTTIKFCKSEVQCYLCYYGHLTWNLDLI